MPVCLLILFSILLLAVNYTASASAPDLNTVATAVSNVNQTATAQEAGKRPRVEPTKVPTLAPTQKLPTPTKTPKG